MKLRILSALSGRVQIRYHMNICTQAALRHRQPAILVNINPSVPHDIRPEHSEWETLVLRTESCSRARFQLTVLDFLIVLQQKDAAADT